MPYKLSNYNNSKIYKIEHLEKPELVYIGSTTQFNRRKASHKRACYNETGSVYNLKLYDMMRANGGWNEFKMMVIKEYPCINKTELLIEEEKHRKEYQATLNQIKAYRTEEEAKQYYEANKEKYKEYYEANKEKYKEYYEANKEDKQEYQKHYNKVNKEHIKQNTLDNKDKMKQYQKDWYQANKLKKLIIQKEEPILTVSPSETETDDEESDEPQIIEPQIIEVLGNGVKFEIQIY
jgi:hypothetical protein